MGKKKSELPQGTLDLLILKALSLGPMHGYGIGQRIRGGIERLPVGLHGSSFSLFDH